MPSAATVIILCLGAFANAVPLAIPAASLQQPFAVAQTKPAEGVTRLTAYACVQGPCEAQKEVRAARLRQLWTSS